MTTLNFRVIVPYYQEEPDIQALKASVESCGVVVQSIQKTQNDQKENTTAGIISEYSLDVISVNEYHISNRDKILLYKGLRDTWLDVNRRWPLGTRPLLQFAENECFLRCRKPCHLNLSITEVFCGVHPRGGEFFSYAKIASECKGNFFHDCRELEILIYLSRDVFDRNEYRKLLISYKHIRNITVDISDDNVYLFLDLIHPPLFMYLKPKRLSRNFHRRFFNRHAVEEHFDISHICPFNVTKDVIGKSSVLLLKFRKRHDFEEILSSLRFRCEKLPVNFVRMNITQKAPPRLPNIILHHFGCAYLLEAMIKRSFNILEQADNVTSYRKLEELCADNPKCFEKALSDVLFAMDSGKLINYWKTIESQFMHYKNDKGAKNVNEYVVPSKCRLIRRVTITPTRILLWPPELMCENRILRNFDSDYFLRVTFRDDDMLTMNFRRYDSKMFIETIQKPMNSGIVIGSRVYELLAWSSSQLREHGVSMYARDSKGYSATDIREWVEISPSTNMNVPKCLARIGQCFSQTEDTLRVPLDNRHVRVEDDVEGGRNPVTSLPYCFTDGVGKISVKLANQVRNILRHDKDCSAFQIRYSGFKGMLVVDPTLKDADIIFRRSMQKFCSRGEGHTKLEIAKPSSPIRLRLNRPLIAILNDLNVPHEVFLRMQEEMLKNLTDMLIDEEVARIYLNARTPFSDLKFKDLSESGVGLTAEPFFRTLLLALHRYYIDIVKTKANIDIDPSEGRNMFGVTDETGTLKYGQVFVQYSKDVTNNATTPDDTIILTGEVMVTKCPCVHPGDVRKFTAVDVPALHHIIDCIVFPQRGPRPHPDEISGSDLDGDEYAVIWKKDIFFKCPNNAPPNYPKVTSANFSNVHDFLAYSKTEDVVNFLIDYIKQDQIGSIASAHLAWADQANIRDDICIGIARKHSVVVDFAKTGVSAQLDRDEVPKMWPDFMEKFWKRRYRSKKSLGKLYRISKDFENENISSSLHYQNIQIDPSLIVPGWENFEQSAINSKNKFNAVLRTILQTYGIRHETEAFGGAFIKLHSKFRERRDRSEIVNIVHTWIKELIKVTKEEFMAEFKDTDDYLNVKDVTSSISRKASAWYVVTYRERCPEFLSFPWIVSDILSNIRIMRSDQIQNKDVVFLHMPLVSKLESVIRMNDDHGQLRMLHRDAAYFLNFWDCLVDRDFVEKAIRVLTKWAQEERIISFSENERCVLYYKTFLRIIFFVAEHEGYVCKAGSVATARCSNPSSAFLCLAFFKYCVKLRFCNKVQVREILGFDVYKDRILSKRAMVTYHSIAVTGYFGTLCNEEFFDTCNEVVEMKPVPIASEIFGGSPILVSAFENANSILKKHSEVEEVYMRENSQTKKVIVTAFGSVSALRRLETLLRKSDMYLKNLFNTGVLSDEFPQVLDELPQVLPAL